MNLQKAVEGLVEYTMTVLSLGRMANEEGLKELGLFSLIKRI